MRLSFQKRKSRSSASKMSPPRQLAWLQALPLLTALMVSPAMLFSDPGGQPAEELPKVTIALQWQPQSQFAGYYMAVEKGFYREVGLDVKLIHAGPGRSAQEYLKTGAADFATLFLTDAIKEAGSGAQIAHIAQLMQSSNLMLVAWKNMGIAAPTDLDGRRVSLWPGTFSVAFEAFFRKHQIQPQLVPQHRSVNLFLEQGVAACAAMSYNEYHRIFQSGIDFDELTVFAMQDHGLGFPEDGLYTSSATAEEQPELCRNLAAATLRGWRYAREHPEESVDIVLQISQQEALPNNRPHSRWMLEKVLDSIFPEGDSGESRVLNRETYEAALRELITAEIIARAPAYSAFAPLATGGQP
jgi:NitT/TauT family transport system substrate-binding protein